MVVALAQANNSITDEQYEENQGRRAQSIVLNKILHYGVSHQKRSEAAYTDDDADACYDRILPSLVSVETRKWELNHKATTLSQNIIEAQRFSVKTGHGIYERQYAYSTGDQIWSGDWMVSSDTICRI